MLSGQIILARSNKHIYDLFHEKFRSNTPYKAPIISLYNILGSCSINTVLNKALSREQNTRRYDENKNLGSGKSKNLNGISGYGRFFHKKSGSNTPPGGPLTDFTLFSHAFYTNFLYGEGSRGEWFPISVLIISKYLLDIYQNKKIPYLPVFLFQNSTKMCTIFPNSFEKIGRFPCSVV